MKTSITIAALCCLLALGLSGCRNPDVVSANIYLFQQNDPDRAMAQLEKALQANPNDAEAHYLLGQVYVRKKLYPDMLKEFDSSLAIKNKFKSKIDSTKNKIFFSLYNSAVNDFNNSKLDRAIEDLKVAVMIEPQDQQGWALLGKSLIRNTQQDEAITALSKAVELDPNFEVISDHVLLMQIYYEQGQLEEALNAATEILRFDESNIDAVKVSAFCYNALGQTEKALEYYENLLQDQPDDADLVFNLGLLYEDMGQYDEAVSYLMKAFELNPTDLEAVLHCAQVFLEIKNDNMKAVECYEKALEIDPDNVGILNNLGVALIRAGEELDDQELINRGTAAIQRAASLKEGN
jgi:tetratricopeptide (TPR) repeat protein